MKKFLITIGGLVVSIYILIFLVSFFSNPLGRPVNESISHSHFYNKSGDGILYSFHGAWFKIGSLDIVGADIESFTPVSEIYAVDIHNVYHKYEVLQNIDPKTFKYLNEKYIVDKNHVYYINRRGEYKVIDMADISSFVGETITDKIGVPLHYGRDQYAIFCKDQVISHDVERFHSVLDKTGDERYFADRENVYNMVNCRETGVNPETFRVLKTEDGDWSHYAIDRNKVYFLFSPDGNAIEGADAETFRVLGDPYNAVDKNREYSFGK